LPKGELGVGEAEEPAVTFVENAILKARHAARVLPPYSIGQTNSA